MATIPRDRLMAMINRGRSADDRPARIPFPRPNEVLYAPPNPDGKRKTCANCYKWVIAGRCLEVAGEIAPGQVCGYHVFGKSQVTDLLAYTGAGDGPLPVVKMTPEIAGLIDTPGGVGTSCNLCRFYSAPPDGEEDYGLCGAVGSTDGFPPVIIEPLGCCARWEAGSR